MRSTRNDCCRAVDLLHLGLRLHGLRDLGDLYEVRTVCSFYLHCMAGIAICAGVAGNSSRVPRIGRNARTPGMGASLTAVQFSAG
jgi:hypothetical protein